MYLRWLCFLPASLAFDVFGRLLAPIVVLFADDNGQRISKRLSCNLPIHRTGLFASG